MRANWEKYPRTNGQNIIRTLMSSRTAGHFLQEECGSSINQTVRLFSADSSEYFPRPGVPLLRTLRSHCGPVGRGEIQKYRTPQNTERARYWLPLASLHPDNSSRCEGCSEQWVASVGYQMKTNHVLMLCEHVRRKALASIFNWRERKGCQMF